MAIVAEKHQQRVAAERYQIAAVVAHHLNHRREDMVEEIGHQLDALATEGAQTLG